MKTKKKHLYLKIYEVETIEGELVTLHEVSQNNPLIEFDSTIQGIASEIDAIEKEMLSK